MSRNVTALLFTAALALAASSLRAQEVTINHGFLFFAGEKYTLDEKTYGIYEDGHKFKEVIKENAKALDQFSSYRTWHTMALVSTGMAIASCVGGGAFYMFEDDLSRDLGDSFGLIMFGAGGGLLVVGVVFEFIAWGSLSSAAETYNKGLMDDLALVPEGIPVPTLGLGPDYAHLSLTWRF